MLIYIFKQPANSVAIHLYMTKNSQNQKLKLVRNRGPGIAFEMIKDPKTGRKIIGLSNVINFLSGNASYNNLRHDFFSWLATSFDVSCPGLSPLGPKQPPFECRGVKNWRIRDRRLLPLLQT